MKTPDGKRKLKIRPSVAKRKDGSPGRDSGVSDEEENEDNVQSDEVGCEKDYFFTKLILTHGSLFLIHVC